MFKNLQQIENPTKNSGRMASMNTDRLKAIIALLLALSLIPTISGVALIA